MVATATQIADPSTATDALGNVTDDAYTSTNLVYCQIDPAEVDDSVTCPSSAPTTPPSAGAGQSSTYLGAEITYYDSAGKPTYVTSPTGYTSQTAYTANGQVYGTVTAKA